MSANKPGVGTIHSKGKGSLGSNWKYASKTYGGLSLLYAIDREIMLYMQEVSRAEDRMITQQELVVTFDRQGVQIARVLKRLELMGCVRMVQEYPRKLFKVTNWTRFS